MAELCSVRDMARDTSPPTLTLLALLTLPTPETRADCTTALKEPSFCQAPMAKRMNVMTIASITTV